MILFKSKLRRKIEAELMKLYKELADLNVQKRKSYDTKAHADLIVKCWQIEHDIELLKKLIVEPKKQK